MLKVFVIFLVAGWLQFQQSFAENYPKNIYLRVEKESGDIHDGKLISDCKITFDNPANAIDFPKHQEFRYWFQEGQGVFVESDYNKRPIRRVKQYDGNTMVFEKLNVTVFTSDKTDEIARGTLFSREGASWIFRMGYDEAVHARFLDGKTFYCKRENFTGVWEGYRDTVLKTVKDDTLKGVTSLYVHFRTSKRSILQLDGSTDTFAAFHISKNEIMYFNDAAVLKSFTGGLFFRHTSAEEEDTLPPRELEDCPLRYIRKSPTIANGFSHAKINVTVSQDGQPDVKGNLFSQEPNQCVVEVITAEGVDASEVFKAESKVTITWIIEEKETKKTYIESGSKPIPGDRFTNPPKIGFRFTFNNSD